jgi:hypothetical protein
MSRKRRARKARKDRRESLKMHARLEAAQNVEAIDTRHQGRVDAQNGALMVQDALVINGDPEEHELYCYD